MEMEPRISNLITIILYFSTMIFFLRVLSKTAVSHEQSYLAVRSTFSAKLLLTCCIFSTKTQNLAPEDCQLTK